MSLDFANVGRYKLILHCGHRAWDTEPELENSDTYRYCHICGTFRLVVECMEVEDENIN